MELQPDPLGVQVGRLLEDDWGANSLVRDLELVVDLVVLVRHGRHDLVAHLAPGHHPVQRSCDRGRGEGGDRLEARPRRCIPSAAALHVVRCVRRFGHAGVWHVRRRAPVRNAGDLLASAPGELVAVHDVAVHVDGGPRRLHLVPLREGVRRRRGEVEVHDAGHGVLLPRPLLLRVLRLELVHLGGKVLGLCALLHDVRAPSLVVRRLRAAGVLRRLRRLPESADRAASESQQIPPRHPRADVVLAATVHRSHRRNPPLRRRVHRALLHHEFRLAASVLLLVRLPGPGVGDHHHHLRGDLHRPGVLPAHDRGLHLVVDRVLRQRLLGLVRAPLLRPLLHDSAADHPNGVDFAVLRLHVDHRGHVHAHHRRDRLDRRLLLRPGHLRLDQGGLGGGPWRGAPHAPGTRRRPRGAPACEFAASPRTRRMRANARACMSRARTAWCRIRSGSA
mmetsp:Transcript_78750/g.227718  ORF Transcript_78750/g.227718 Transcript_78750/m.227718 type:complete len:449 (+) Transcript_78750:777-2123(+)